MKELPACIELAILQTLVTFLTGNLEAAKTQVETILLLDPDNVKVQTLRDCVLSVESDKAEGNYAFSLGEWHNAVGNWTDALKVSNTVYYNATALTLPSHICTVFWQ